MDTYVGTACGGEWVNGIKCIATVHTAAKTGSKGEEQVPNRLFNTG